MIKNNICIAFVLALVFAIAMIVAGCQPTENQSIPFSTEHSPLQSTSDTHSYQKYTNAKYSFSVQYPTDWSARENYNGSVVVFGAPKQPDGYTPNINIFAYKLSDYDLITLADFLNWSKSQMKGTGQNVKISGDQITSIDGMSASITTITATSSSNDTKYELKDLRADFIRNGIGYSIMLDSEGAFTEKYVEYFNQTVYSFKFDIPSVAIGDTKMYKNEKYGFSLQYPSTNWDALEDYRGNPLVLFGPKSPQGYTPAIAVEIMDPPNKEVPFTLDDYLKWEKLQAKRTLTDFQIIEEHPSMVGGQPAIITTFAGNIISNNTEVKLKDIGASWVKNGVGYSITLDCEETLTDSYSKYFDLVVHSLRFDTD